MLGVILPFVLFFGMGILGIGLVFGLSAYTRQKLNESWGSLASRTGLVMQQGGMFTQPSLEGTYRGRPLRLYTYTVSHGKSSTTYTAVALSTKNTQGGKLSLRRENPFDSIGKALGMKDVQIGDPTFDQQALIKSSPEDFASRLLGGDSLLRDEILRLPALNVEINGDTISQRQTGLNTNTEQLYTVFETLSKLADAVEGGREKSGFDDSNVESASVFDEQDSFGGKDEFGAQDEFGEDEAIANDPFYQKKSPSMPAPTPMPSPEYLYSPAPSSGSNRSWLPILIVAFVAFDLLVTAAVAIYFFAQ